MFYKMTPFIDMNRIFGET